jgi:hypothetical protein
MAAINDRYCLETIIDISLILQSYLLKKCSVSPKMGDIKENGETLRNNKPHQASENIK